MKWAKYLMWTSAIVFSILLIIFIFAASISEQFTSKFYGNLQMWRVMLFSLGLFFLMFGITHNRKAHMKERKPTVGDVIFQPAASVSLLPWWMVKILSIVVALIIFWIAISPDTFEVVLISIYNFLK